MDAAGHRHIPYIPLLIHQKIHQYTALDAVIHGIFRIPQVLVYPLLQEGAGVVGIQEHGFYVYIAEGHGAGRALGRNIGIVAPERGTLAVAQPLHVIVNIFQFLLHAVVVYDVPAVAAGVVLRVSARSKEDGGNLLVVKSPVVAGIGFRIHQSRLHRKQFALKGLHQHAQVLVGRRVGHKGIGPRAHHIQIYHGIYAIRVREGTVEEVPRPGTGFLRCAESHKKHAPAQQRTGIGQLLGQFQHHGQAGGVPVGAIIDAPEGFPVHGERICAQIIQTGADYYVSAIQGLVPALQEAQHIAAFQRIGPFDQAEGGPAFRADDIHPIFPEVLRHIVGRQFFSFAARLPAFQFGRCQVRYMFLEGPDRFRVFQGVQRGTVAVLGKSKSSGRQSQKKSEGPFHHSFTRIHPSSGQISFPRNWRTVLSASFKSLVGHTETASSPFRKLMIVPV